MKKLIILFLVCLLTTSAFGQWPFQQKPMLGKQIDWSHSLTKGLVGCWLFNEGSGNKVFDLSGNGNNGIFTGDLSWIPGQYGPTLDFPGSNDYITIAHSQSFAFDGPFTIHVRCCIDVDSDGMFIYHYDASTQDGFYIYYEDANNKIQAIVFVGGSVITCETDATVVVGVNVYDVTFVRDSAGLCTLYLDGIAQADTETLAGAIDSSGPIYLGCDLAIAKDLNGGEDFLYLWNRALSTSEIALRYREPFCFMKPDWNWLLYGAITIPTAGGQIIIIGIN